MDAHKITDGLRVMHEQETEPTIEPNQTVWAMLGMRNDEKELIINDTVLMFSRIY